MAPGLVQWTSSVGAAPSTSSLLSPGTLQFGSITTLRGELLGLMSGPRTVSDGLSRITVLIPTRIAIESARSS